MSQQQIALFTLKEISSTPTLGNGAYSISVTAGGEVTQLSLTLTGGSSVPLAEHLQGQQPPPSPAPINMPVSISISGGNPSAPFNGTGTGSFVIQPGISPQTFTMQVTAGNPYGQSATVTLNYEAVYRDYPVCYDPEWLCRNRNALASYERWLCIGRDLMPDFLTLSAVTTLQSTLAEHTPRMQRISNEQGLGYSPAGSSFFDYVDFTFDVSLAAAPLIPTLSWARRYMIEDFNDALDDRMQDYIVVASPILPVSTMELCARWREILDCYCRFCRRWTEMPTAAINHYNSVVAPLIDSLYPNVVIAAQTEGVALTQVTSGVNCDKLAYIVSFWAWWCRRCALSPTYLPPWSASVEPYYSPLYDARNLMNDILQVNNLGLCNPPEKDFCGRWRAVLDCLKKLCDRRSELPPSLVSDLDLTFGSILRAVYSFFNYQPQVYAAAGVGNTCGILGLLQKYFAFICPDNTIPGGRVRRDQLDTYLLQIESAMSGFTSRNGDLCAVSTPMTNCDDFQAILPCLARICAKQAELTDESRQSFIDSFGQVIADLYNIINDTNLTYPDIEGLCSAISFVRGYFDNVACPDTPIDPILKLLLLDRLDDLQSAMTSFIAGNTDLCVPDVEVPTAWCDQWTTILDCLDRICGAGYLPVDAFDRVTDLFAPLANELDWLIGDPSQPYSVAVETWALSDLCSILYRLRDYIDRICASGVVDTIRMIRLADLLSRFQAAYAVLLSEYPSICTQVTTDDCEKWIGIFDCLARICDAWKTDPQDPALIDLIGMIQTTIGDDLHSVYLIFLETEPTSFSNLDEKACVEIHGILDYLTAGCACCGGELDTQKQLLAQGALESIELAYGMFSLCDPDCHSSQVSLTTGVAPWVVTRIDDILLNRPQGVNVVTGTAGIGTPVGGSDWISPHPTADDPHVGWTIFERCFCVCTEGEVQIDITYIADDYAEIMLDDTLIDYPDEANMHHTRTYGGTASLTQGRHCVRIKVRNDPAFNMALSALGSITPVTAVIADGACCGDTALPVPFCRDGVLPDCDRLTALPYMYQFFCCPARDAEDPIFATPEYADIVDRITCFEGEIDWVMLRIGMPAGSLPPAGSGFCDRYRRVLRLLALAFAGYEQLPVLIRLKIDCLYDGLRSDIDALALARVDDPLPCAENCGACGAWMGLLNCLCRHATLIPTLPASYGSAISQAQSIICGDIDSFYSYLSATYTSEYLPEYMTGTPDSCWVAMRRSVVFALIECFCCTDMSTQRAADMSGWYTQLTGKLDQITPILADSGALAPRCDDFCARWTVLLECLEKIGLRRGELPQNLKTEFDLLFTSRISSVYQTIFGVSAPSSPFTSDVIESTGWRIYRILRRFYWLCSPLHFWDTSMRASLATALEGLESAYAGFASDLATAGIHICQDGIDFCDRLSRLPDLFLTICATDPVSTQPPVQTLETLLAQVSADLPSLQRQLGLPATAYPTEGSFCDRLEFAVGIIATAYARYAELSPANRVLVDFFYAILNGQSSYYAWLIRDDLPLPQTAMTVYRGKWTDLLNCICRACDFVAGMTTQQRSDLAATVTLIESPASDLLAAIDVVHATVVALAPQLGLPLTIDPCATDLCRKLKIVIGFFDTWCLRCSEPSAPAAAQLDPLFDGLREQTVALRSSLAVHGIYLCAEEDYSTVIVQSSSLYLQAAGSDGDDGSSKGIHLRWALLNDLGDHLPKGDLAKPGTTNFGTNTFNQGDDFVRIYRTPYSADARYAVEIDLATRLPDDIAGDNAGGVAWIYNLDADPGFPGIVTTVAIGFTAGLYPLPVPTATTVTTAHLQSVIAQYDDIYRVEAVPKLMFACEVELQTTGAGQSVKFEAISRNDDPNVDDPEFLSARRTVTSGSNVYRITSENVDYVLFKAVNGSPATVRVETYDDFYIATRRRYLWKKIGELALSLDDTEVYRRLESAGQYDIDGLWPRFETAQSVGRVNAANYRDRWVPGPAYGRDSRQSLKSAVQEYIELSSSASNVLAYVDKPSVMDQDLTYITVSLQQLLQLGAQDFHIARMLGLGQIDWEVGIPGSSGTQQYMYVAEYRAAAGVDGETTPTTHRFLSLPTARVDTRLPVEAEIDRIEFGLDDGFTIDGGYTRFGTARFVRIYRQPSAFDLPVGTFFDDTIEFGRDLSTRPLLFGIKYGSGAGSAITWDFPDPSNDAADYVADSYRPYLDTAGLPEVVPIPDGVQADGVPQPLFTHMVQNTPANQGDHAYAIYSINWFSRPSSVGSAVEVTNAFPVLNLLQPPLNLAAQYIQPEDPLLFTSATEQSAEYYGKTRITFDWCHTQNIAYRRATHVDLYFRPSEAAKIEGQIETSLPYSDSAHTTRVTTAPYAEGAVTIEGGITVSPDIESVDLPKFVGSFLVTGTNKYPIVSVMRESNGRASFIVEQVPTIGPDGDPDPSAWVAPRVGETFLVVENVMRVDETIPYMAGWTRLASHRIGLVDFTAGPYSQDYHEDVTRNGRTESVPFGGLYDASGVVKYLTDAGAAGVYEVRMPNVTLAPYTSQFAGVTWVDFYRGIARVQEYGGTEMRTVTVLKIVERATVRLLVFDPEERIGPNTGTEVAAKVNFHPSYRAYVDWEVEGIPETDILPALPETSRLTMIAAKSVDTGHSQGGEPFRSALTAPTVHLAQRLIGAETPLDPAGPAYATRPDIYGKATYMLDTPIASGRAPGEPYGMFFLRADEMAILSVLYRKSTVTQILASIPDRHLDTHLSQRWRGLIDVTVDGAMEFLSFVDDPGTYRFPHPDRATDPDDPGTHPEFNGSNPPGAIAPVIKAAISEAFLPLTESYVVYDRIRTDSLQTSGARPVTRGSDGRLLDPDDPAYDPYPMVRRGVLNGSSIVRFGDYTLDGTSRNIYFYCVREIGSDLKYGPPSLIHGPVRLVNSNPPQAPQVTRVSAQAPNPALQVEASVTFAFNAYPAPEQIARVAIFRAMSEADSRFLSSMQLVDLIVLAPGTPAGGSYVIEDTFADIIANDESVPYGRPLYYRLVVYRSIINERGYLEYVPSIPSDVLVANIVDTIVPSAPAIMIDCSEQPDSYENMRLYWSNDVYYGTYALYQLSDQGQWVRLETYAPSPNQTTLFYPSNGQRFNLPKLDANGNRIAHRYKVVVINSSGLVSRRDQVLTL